MAAHRSRIHPWLLLAGIWLAYANAIPNGFVWDDHEQNFARMLERVTFGDVFTKPAWTMIAGREEPPPGAIHIFRPIPMLTLLADTAVWGVQRTWGYHLTSVFFFSALAVVLLALLGRFVASEWAALTLCAAFCLQPALTEGVSWISGRHDLLLCLTLVACTYCVVRAGEDAGARRTRWTAAGLAGYALALLCKEPAATFPVILAALLWLSPLHPRFTRREKLTTLAAYALITAAFLYYRSTVVARNSMVGGGTGLLAALQTAPWVATKFMASFVYTPHLSSHYLQPRVHGFGLLQFWVPLLGHAALLATAWALRKRHWAPLLGLLVYYVTLAPAAVVIANKPEYSLRFLFVPSLGLLVALAAPLGHAFRRSRPEVQRVCAAAIVVALALQAIRIHERNLDYADNETFYASIVRDAPESPIGYYGLATWLHRQGRLDEAFGAYRAALERAPAMPQVANNFGVLLTERGLQSQARAVFEQALAGSPNHPKLHYNLARVQAAQGEIAAAERSLARAIELDPEYRDAYRQLYNVYRMTDEQKALVFRKRHARWL